MLTPSSKTGFIFTNGSISIIQFDSAAADALSSGQEKDARAYLSGLVKSSPTTPMEYQQHF